MARRHCTCTGVAGQRDSARCCPDVSGRNSHALPVGLGHSTLDKVLAILRKVTHTPPPKLSNSTPGCLTKQNGNGAHKKRPIREQS